MPFKNAFIAKRDFFILEVQKVGDVLTWVPVKTYEQVLLGDLDLRGAVVPVGAPSPLKLRKTKSPLPRIAAGGSVFPEVCPAKHGGRPSTWPAGCLPG